MRCLLLLCLCVVATVATVLIALRTMRACGYRLVAPWAERGSEFRLRGASFPAAPAFPTVQCTWRVMDRICGRRRACIDGARDSHLLVSPRQQSASYREGYDSTKLCEHKPRPD